MNIKVNDIVKLPSGESAKIVAVPEDTCFKGLLLFKRFMNDGTLGHMNHSISQSEVAPFMRMENKPEVILALAKGFSAELKRTLSPEQFTESVKRNSVEEEPSICHSHDFCDANMVMDEAFKTVFGASSHDVDPDEKEHDHMSDLTCNVWSAAWSLAKENNFNP